MEKYLKSQIEFLEYGKWQNIIFLSICRFQTKKTVFLFFLFLKNQFKNLLTRMLKLNDSSLFYEKRMKVLLINGFANLKGWQRQLK